MQAVDESKRTEGSKWIGKGNCADRFYVQVEAGLADKETCHAF
jgi:hypothetical protein